jgi:hypothetical protein
LRIRKQRKKIKSNYWLSKRRNGSKIRLNKRGKKMKRKRKRGKT